MIKAKMSHRVFLEDDGSVVLEVQGRGFTVYSIKDYQIEEIGNKPLTEGEDRSSDYFDFVSGETIKSIELLTTVFDHKSLIEDLQTLKALALSSTYSYVQFDMDHANTLVDLIDATRSLNIQTDEFSDKIVEFENFTDKFFFNKDSNFTEEDKIEVKRGFDSAILFLSQNMTN